MNNLKYNKSGYIDNTAYKAINKVDEEKQKANIVIKLIKDTARIAGFEIINRIELENKNSGSIYK
ncbi:hypothetical protein [Clostridioides sp. ES-S-0001-02]|uniref:hypothetical protein n=1 Tax=Clostridioides sp. ES-S-0001-02 TaxID=2770770 RepID=UPI001D112272|nr:hypothetical protein [Clostridioides sp. ES-S-0001-02]